MIKTKIRTSLNTKLSSLKQMGGIDLNAQDLKLMKYFYQKILNLEIIEENKDSIIFAKNKTQLITLHHDNDLQSANPRAAGLYHFALLFSSRSELAITIERILRLAPKFFSGSADHLVSEAFYFSDPEGNGIELYYDRDESIWQWKDGQIKMATLYIDPMSYINKYAGLAEKDIGIKMGHIHLKVGDIEKAKLFYVDILGFDITALLPGALFVSVNGYHHHLGMNTWESYGAEPGKEALGLKQFAFELSDREDFQNLKYRLRQNQVRLEEDKELIIFRDPWQNQIKVQLIANF